jgi:hypothetical protein
MGLCLAQLNDPAPCFIICMAQELSICMGTHPCGYPNSSNSSQLHSTQSPTLFAAISSTSPADLATTGCVLDTCAN